VPLAARLEVRIGVGHGSGSFASRFARSLRAARATGQFETSSGGNVSFQQPAQIIYRLREAVAYRYLRSVSRSQEAAPMNVLLVEDDSMHAQMIQLALAKEAKIKVHWATHIAQARTLLLSIAFQLVLLDYTLPDGNGFDLFYELRARFTTLPIVFLTALNSAE